ncbi:MAG: peptidoglycan-binding protein [Parcubacteria group bacterium]|nr:peptidoglycan-binding protein [Parcubacteria group bacterium]MCR4342293.1 peptidoglycan-binding protein [Patescibacteria group bacterium]
MMNLIKLGYKEFQVDGINIIKKLTVLAIVSFFLFFSFVLEIEAATESVSIIRQDCAGYSKCYTSLSSWEAAEQKDLVSSNEIATARIEGTWTNPDITPLTIDGWVTGINNYIKIYTAIDARHKGVAGSGYRIAPNVPGNTITVNEDYTRLIGLEIKLSSAPAVSDEGVRIQANNVSIDKSIIWSGNKNVADTDGIYQGNSSYTVGINNSIIYGFSRACIHAQSYSSTAAYNQTWNIKNSTLFNCGSSGEIESGAINVRTGNSGTKVNVNLDNTIGINTYGNYNDFSEYSSGSISGIITWSGGNNITGDSSANKGSLTSGLVNRVATSNVNPGAGNWVVFSSIYPGLEDFHLANSSENDALGNGSNLSAYFTGDIDNESRSNIWDIGADKYSAIEVSSVSTADTTNNTTTDTTTNTTISTTNDIITDTVNNATDIANDTTAIIEVYQCNDGLDNDNDGLSDFPSDIGCSSSSDNDEWNVIATPVQNNNFNAATTHYVRAGASGSNSGLDWSNAWTSLPQTLVRGHTYYIADGSYPSYTFDDALSGSSWIYIKKATIVSHGTNTGWQNSYGDGEAIFSPIKVLTGYYEIDGQVGGGPGSWTSGFGFKIQYTGSGDTAKLISIGNSNNTNVRNLVFKHIEMVYTSNLNPPTSATGQDAIYAVYGGGDWKFQYDYIRNASRVLFYTHDFTGSKVRNILVEYSRLERNGANPSSGQHSEIWSARQTNDVVVRYNQIIDFRSTGGFIIGWADTWDFYGNIFWWKNDQGGTANNGAIGTWSSDSTYYASNVKIYNNTFVNLSGGGSGRLFPIYNKISNISAYNNLWYNSPTANFGNGVLHDYNWYKNSNENSISESNKQIGSADPFVNYSAGNFSIKSATLSGKPLGSPYNVDMNGLVRGADGVWDRGAYEYSKTLSPSIVSVYQCNDSLDNDNDGLSDFPSDIGCSSSSDNDEYNAPVLAENIIPDITNTAPSSLDSANEPIIQESVIIDTIQEPSLIQDNTSTQTTIIAAVELTGPFFLNYENEQVKVLQRYLAQEKEIYPEGIISGYYGALTVQAVQRFQCKYMGICQGTPITNGYGIAGPSTRTKIMEIYGGYATTVISSTQGQLNQIELIQQLQAQINQLQVMLNQLLEQFAILIQLQLQNTAQ